jgi:hypothetical protein
LDRRVAAARYVASRRSVSDASSDGRQDANLPGGVEEALLAWLEQAEERWCEQPVPARGGRTPREAAADPTRREDLVRLLASFPEPTTIGPTGGGFGPSRLRAILGL